MEAETLGEFRYVKPPTTPEKTLHSVAPLRALLNQVTSPTRFHMIARDRALALLTQCTGETIWPIDLCIDKSIPKPWIDELSDAFESSFDHDRDTIYFNEQKTNQFHGIRDVDLAAKLGESLGIDVGRLQQQSLGRAALVAAIKEAVMEG
ncbi:hypothetical protein LF1_03230 [Rubripirellula obstinata]|uniref:Uncharacterized protein n=1 Tax=Rubripirellula obstinata TaxID=406547 RepID=A0A5B1CEE3_9BACT|nr:hypothetical protein [Rubripirellula obstinata]KAA1257833.1 hypothetical protein LF1_03230 [Rubripirellula obstinata]